MYLTGQHENIILKKKWFTELEERNQQPKQKGKETERRKEVAKTAGIWPHASLYLMLSVNIMKIYAHT